MDVNAGLNALGAAVSNSYQSFLGNTFSQNNYGSQVSNTFGKMTNVFIDAIRLWEETILTLNPNDPTQQILAFIPTPASLRAEFLQKVASLGGMGGADLGFIGRETDAQGLSQWAGSTSLNIGDVATLNYKGTNVNVFRAVNQLQFCPGSGPENLESFQAYEAQMMSFFYVVWGVGTLASLVFAEYSVTVAVDQDLQNNESWQIANLAMETAQILVLYLMGNFEDSKITSLMAQELQSASLASDDGQINRLEDSINDLQDKLQKQIDAMQVQISNLQLSTLDDLASLAESVSQIGLQAVQNTADQSQLFAIAMQNQVLLLNSLLVGLGLEVEDESLLQELEATTSQAIEDASFNQEMSGMVKARVAALNAATKPATNTTVPVDNLTLTSANLDGGAALNPTLAEVSSLVEGASTVAQTMQDTTMANTLKLGSQTLAYTQSKVGLVATELRNLVTATKSHEAYIQQQIAQPKVRVKVLASDQKGITKKIKRMFVRGTWYKWVETEVTPVGGDNA
jgi:hypothetical protein